MKRRILSFLMVLAMVASMLPAQILAAESYNAIVIVQDNAGEAIKNTAVAVNVTRGGETYAIGALDNGRYGFNKDKLTQTDIYDISVDAIGYESQPVTMHGTTNSILVTLTAVAEQWRTFTVCDNAGTPLLAGIQVDIIKLNSLCSLEVSGANWTFKGNNSTWATFKTCMDAESIATLEAAGLTNFTTFKKVGTEYTAVVDASVNGRVELYDQNGEFFWAGENGASDAVIQAQYAKQLDQKFAWETVSNAQAGNGFLDRFIGTYVGAEKTVYQVVIKQKVDTGKYYAAEAKSADNVYVVIYTDGVDGEDLFPDERYAVAAGNPIPKIDNPSREGYSFSGWVLEDASEGEKIDDTVTRNLSFHAMWEIAPQYMATVKVYVDGKYDSAAGKAYEGTPTDIETVLGPDAKLYVSTDGSIFEPMKPVETGVYHANLDNGDYRIYYALGEGEKTKLNEQILWMENANHTCYLFFSSITYQDKDDQGELVTTKVGYGLDGMPVTILEEVPAREGYQFIGWQDAEGKLYQPGQEIISKNCVLTAQWITEGTAWSFEFPITLHSTAAGEGITAVNVQILRQPISGGEMTPIPAAAQCVVLTNGEGVAIVEAEMGYYYSVEIVSYVIGSETIVTEKYTPIVKVEGVDVPGAYVHNGEQKGSVTTIVYLLNSEGYKITFDLQQLGFLQKTELTGQKYVPDISAAEYTPTPLASILVFKGWSVQSGQQPLIPGEPLIGDLILQAQWGFAGPSTPSTPSEPPASTETLITVKGRVAVDATYMQGEGNSATEQTIHKKDRVKTVTVLLQQDTTFNGYYETIKQASVNVQDELNGYVGGVGTYSFENLPKGNYRIVVLSPNYSAVYQNELASVQQPNNFATYTEVTYQASDLNGDNIATVNARMMFTPPSFDLAYQVDASAIGESYRPETVEVLVTYDDRTPALTDPSQWAVISQMVFGEALKGDAVELDSNGVGESAYPVWKSNSDGSALYDYGIRVGGLENDHVEIKYQAPAHLDTISGGQSQMLKATLVPKTYKIKYELNGGTLSGVYSTEYTWSYETSLADVVPVRSGYQFMGWKIAGVTTGWNGSAIAADATIAEGTDTITLYATWSRVVVNLQVLMDHTGAGSYSGNLFTNLTSRSDSNGNYQIQEDHDKTFGSNIWHTNEAVDVVEIPYIYTELSDKLEYSATAAMDSYYVIDSYAFDENNVVTSRTGSVIKNSAYTTEEAYNVVVCLKYDPDMLTLRFSVEMDQGVSKERWPQTVGAKVTRWNPVSSAWEVIEAHENTVMEISIEENGTGSGEYSVKRWMEDDAQTNVTDKTPYYYRIDVISLTLENDVIIDLEEESKERYIATGYAAEVSVMNGGSPNDGVLPGTYGNETSQVGTLKAVIEMGSVVFNANNEDWEVYNGSEVFRTYYPAPEEGLTQNVSYMETNGTITPFYDIPSFDSENEVEYKVHNEYIFKGWYTKNGEPINWETLTSGSEKVEVFAHWIKVGEVAKEDADGKETTDNVKNYPGFDLVGLQIRFATGDNKEHHGQAAPGMRFVGCMSEALHDQLSGMTSAEEFEYGFLIGKREKVEAAIDKDEDHFEIKYPGEEVNGEDTSKSHASLKACKCNGVEDHYNGENYRLFTFVITYNGLSGNALHTAQATPFLARAYVKYCDANGLVRVYYNNYTGTPVYNGVSASYADVANVLPI